MRSGFRTIDGVRIRVADGHFVWEEGPCAYAAMVTNWVSEGYREPDQR
jgi:hypothetical protein